MILLNPGPVNVSDRVRAAVGGPDLCHRESEYFDLQDAILARLVDVFGAPADDYRAILLTGSGTAMVEAVVSSSVPEGGRLLVVENGVYGERMAAMARAHRIACDTIAVDWTTRVPAGRLEEALAHTRYDAVAIVHHETTTGLLNDLDSVAGVVRRAGVRLLVDGVSALGGEPFDVGQWRPDAVACTANKCVQGLPGLSFALVRREWLDQAAGYPERSFYLHLPRHGAEQARRSTPFTPAIQVGYALLAALDELREETVDGRIARYRRAGRIVRDGFEALGLELLLPPALRSTTLTAVRLPSGVPYAPLHDALKREGFVIYAGQGPLASGLFRVATMGAVTEADYRRFLDALGTAIAAVRGRA
jgi:2-aminoethylphosphonate-pyruvate transaminase